MSERTPDRRIADPAYPDLIGIVGGPMIPCKVVEFNVTMAPTVRVHGDELHDAHYEQAQRCAILYQPAPLPAIVRWECPLRGCNWTREFPSESEANGHVQTGGLIRQHIESHGLMEWAQEVIDLRHGISRD